MQRIVNNIALLSIHIPKTGGSSFQKTLQSLYPADAFQRLDFKVREVQGTARMIATNRTSQQLLDDIYARGELAPNIRVLHGHFHYEDVVKFFRLRPGAAVVSWLRDPVQRTVSNYHYLIASFEREIRHTPRSEELFRRLLKSLPEYARNNRDGSLYADYLRGRALADYAFIGIVEEYDAELRRLAATLGVADLPRFKVNRARRTAPALNAEQAAELAALNQSNLAIYQQAVALRSAPSPQREHS